MKFLLVCLALLPVCAARPQDLRYKMFTFPQETNTDRVTLTTEKQDFGAATVCLRSFTDLTRTHVLFSLATPSHADGLVLFWWPTGPAGLSLYARNSGIRFPGLDYTVNTWHSMCFTWDAVSGVGQLWLDGRHSVRRYISSGHISGTIIITLGQDQDSYGGGFDAGQSLVGMLTDVHMWNETIPRQEIMNFMEKKFFTPGNVLNWRDLEFRVTGRVLVEDSQFPL
ncbi:C-reactive protein-like [Nelusetta ayraudi]|uniref:C-reactive protein-like n=1 Tax=Nelusetta ayraudi TaxID=303726 RepID=UPI003F71FD43